MLFRSTSTNTLPSKLGMLTAPRAVATKPRMLFAPTAETTELWMPIACTEVTTELQFAALKYCEDDWAVNADWINGCDIVATDADLQLR